MTKATGSAASFLKALDDALGENDEAQEVTHFINTGYAPLNVALSGREDGGLPQGRLIEMFGESSTGKTALATKWMVEAQNMGGVSGFMDWERSFAVSLAEGFGLNATRPHWIYKRPATWEEGNTLVARACKAIREAKIIDPLAPIFFVMDSIAAAMPKSVAEKELDELSMNDTTALARVTSTTLKNMAHIAGEYNATILYLNQMRLKPGVVYGDPRTTPGGKAMEFYATCRMALGREKITEGKGKEAEFVGQKIGIQVVKSKLTRPFQSAKLRMMYDEAGTAYFDIVLSSLEFLTEKKAIEMSGAYIQWVDGTKSYPKALAKKIADDPAQLEALKGLLTKALTK